MCSEQLRKGVQFCWKCKADQSKMGPPGWMSDRTTSPGTFGRPRKDGQKKIMSFDAFKRVKTEQQQAGCHFRKEKPKFQDEQVTIFIGMKQLVAEDLRTVRGKKLPICVPKTASYAIILRRQRRNTKLLTESSSIKTAICFYMRMDLQHNLCLVS